MGVWNSWGKCTFDKGDCGRGQKKRIKEIKTQCQFGGKCAANVPERNPKGTPKAPKGIPKAPQGHPGAAPGEAKTGFILTLEKQHFRKSR